MLNERGHEINDPNPMVRPIHLKMEESLAEKIKRMVKYELSQAASEQGHESFEEADDFDIEDEAEDLRSDYELDDNATFGAPPNGHQQTGDQPDPNSGPPAGTSQDSSLSQSGPTPVPPVAPGNPGPAPR